MNEILFCIWSLLGSLFLSLETFDLCIKQRLDPKHLKEWTAAKSNPHAIWSRDSYGEEVVSLLKTISAGSSRELAHQKARCWFHCQISLYPLHIIFILTLPWKAAVTQSELEGADPQDAFQQALSGSLHQETRVFDFGRKGPRCFTSWLPALETCDNSTTVSCSNSWRWLRTQQFPEHAMPPWGICTNQYHSF